MEVAVMKQQVIKGVCTGRPIGAVTVSDSIWDTEVGVIGQQQWAGICRRRNAKDPRLGSGSRHVSNPEG